MTGSSSWYWCLLLLLLFVVVVVVVFGFIFKGQPHPKVEKQTNLLDRSTAYK